MKSLRILLFVVVSFFASQSIASVVAFDNIDRTPGGQPYFNGGWWVGSFPELQQTISNFGVAFSPSTTGYLTAIEAAIATTGGYTGTGLSWSIYSYDGSTSDLVDLLWEADYDQPLTTPFSFPLETFEVSSGPLLEQGQEYWLVFNAVINDETLLRWSASNTGQTADYRFDALNDDGTGFTNYFSTDMPPAFALYVQPIPVPAALWLFASALLGLAVSARRRSGV